MPPTESTFTKNRRVISKLISKLPLLEQKRFINYLEVEDREGLLQIMATEMRDPFCVDLEIWQQMFPKKPYDDTQFRRCTELLMSKLEDFMATRSLRQNQLLQKVFFIRGLATQQIQQQDGFASRYKKALRQIDRLPLENADYYEARSTILKYGLSMGMMPEKQDDVLGKHNIPNLEEAALLYRILYYLCSVVVLKKNGGNEGPLFDLIPAKAWLKMFADSKHVQEIPLLRFLFNLGKFIHEREGELDELIDEMTSVYGSMYEDEFKTLFSILQGLMIRDLNQEGKLSLYYAQLMRLYEWGFEHKIFHINGFLDPSFYNNLTRLHVYYIENQDDKAIDKQALADMFDMLYSYRKDLAKAWRDILYETNLSKIHFSLGDFKAINTSYSAWDFPTAKSAINYQLMAAKALYELGEYKAAIRKFNSLKVFISKHEEINAKERTQFLNLIKFFIKLCNLRIITTAKRTKLERAEKLYAKTEATDFSLGKAWLLAKVETFRKELELATRRKI